MNYQPTYSDTYDPAFPQSSLDTRVELLLGGEWTDISKKVYFRDGVTITYGHPDETNEANPTNAALTINNRSGDFSPRNPLGQYYGLIGRNTPMRISVPNNGVYLRMEDDTTSYASCPDRPSLDTTGDLDIRIDVEFSGYGLCTLASKWKSSTDRAWAIHLDASGMPQLEYMDSTGVDHLVTCDQMIPLGRIAIRATLDVDNGSGGRTVTFYTAPTMAGPWVQLGDQAVNNAGTITLLTSTAPVAVGYSVGYTNDTLQVPEPGVLGAVYSFQLYSGIGTTLVASPDFTAQVPGATSFADAQANIWSMSGTAELSDRRYRAYTEVPAWPPQWDPTGQDVYTQIEGAGLLRRLRAGTPPVQSAMYRAYTRLTGQYAPVAYWPMEDGTQAVTMASALPGGSAMAIYGAPQLASSSAFVCSQPIPSLNGGKFSGPVPVGGTWNSNTVRMLVGFPSPLSSETDLEVIASFNTTGRIKRVEVQLGTAGVGSFIVVGYDATGTQLFTSGPIASNVATKTGGLVRISFGLFKNGGTINWEMDWVQVDGIPGLALGLTGSTGLTGSLGAVTTVDVNPNGTCQQLAAGHVSVQQNDDLITDLQDPLNAYQGEAAGTRFARLCAEQGVACRIYGFPSDTVSMGPQLPGAFVDLLQECEDSDRGLMFEPKQVLALGYRTRPSMFNQAPALALTYTDAQLSAPIAPTDDDQLIQNDLTVTRDGGSSYQATQTDGPLSVLDPPDGVGDYGQAVTVSLGADSQLPDQAGWLLHLGTVDDVRYPSLSVNLARPELAAVYDAAQDVKVGDRVTVASMPGFLPPDGASQVIRGGVEVCYGFTFTETWNCAPEMPYRVAVFDDPVLSRADTDGSVLQGNYSATATSLQVATTVPGAPIWTTSAAEFPFDITVGGERMTVTNITGSSSPQTFTVVRSLNNVAKPQTSGTDVRLFQPAILSM